MAISCSLVTNAKRFTLRLVTWKHTSLFIQEQSHLPAISVPWHDILWVIWGFTSSHIHYEQPLIHCTRHESHYKSIQIFQKKSTKMTPAVQAPVTCLECPKPKDYVNNQGLKAHIKRMHQSAIDQVQKLATVLSPPAPGAPTRGPGKGLVCESLLNSLPLSLHSSLQLSLPISRPLSLPIVPPLFLSHHSLALYCQYSLIIQGQSLDSTNSRGAPPSCSICRSWYLGLWCPCRAWRPPCPPGSRPGREPRQGRKVNTGATCQALSHRVDWSLSSLSSLEPQGVLELIRSSMPHISISLFFIFNIKFPCHWNISRENFLLSPTLSWAYWPPVRSDNPLFWFSLTGGRNDHLLHSLNEF